MVKKESTQYAIEISKVQFSWEKSDIPLLNIEGVSIGKGEKIFIEGPSGAGKSTLLNLIAGVILPETGYINIHGCPLNRLTGAQRDRFRADHIGFIYQMFNLIPYLSVLENIILPLKFSKKRRIRATGSSHRSDNITRAEKAENNKLSGWFRPNSMEIRSEAKRLLRHLGMDQPDIIQKTVTDLSVGQQQRVAAARALIGSPDILIADEPTSALDADLQKEFISLLFEECGKNKTTVVFVSHDKRLEKLFDRTIELKSVQPLSPI